MKENDFQARLLYPAKAKGECGQKTFKLLTMSHSQGPTGGQSSPKERKRKTGIQDREDLK